MYGIYCRPCKAPGNTLNKALIPKCTKIQSLVILDEHSVIYSQPVAAVLFSVGSSLSGLLSRRKAPVMIAEMRRIVLVQLREQFQLSVSAQLCSLLGLFCSILCLSCCPPLFICQAAVLSLILVRTSAVINMKALQLNLTYRNLHCSMTWE